MGCTTLVLTFVKRIQAPYGEAWLHEIKHDGFRVIARKDGARVRLYSRPGNNLTDRFPLIVEALARLRSRSCIIDGDAIQRPRFSGDKARLAERRCHDVFNGKHGAIRVLELGRPLRHS
jgi:ATP-dependent DNA ligase